MSRCPHCRDQVVEFPVHEPACLAGSGEKCSCTGAPTTTGRIVTPRQQQARDVLRPQTTPFGLLDQTDDTLARLRRRLLREVSDLARDGHITQARGGWYEAQTIRHHQLQRFRLRMRYGAVDEHLGTASYECWYRHDQPPTYRLAAAMDRAQCQLGRSHVLDWGDAA